MTQIWHSSYFLSSLFTSSDPLQVLKSILMNWRVESRVLDEGDSAMLQYSFENHSYTFLNLTHHIAITYYMHAQF